VPLAGLGDYASLVAASLFAAFASAWFEMQQRLQLAELRSADYLRASAARGVLSAIFVCSAAYVSHSASRILVALAVAAFIAGVIARESRLNLLHWRFDWSICRALVRFGLPLSISIWLTQTLTSLDRWLLQLLAGPDTVGLFAAGSFVVSMPTLALASGIGILAYSRSVHAVEFGAPEAARLELEHNFVILLGVVLPSAAGIVVLSHNLAELLVGAAYRHAVVQLAPWLSGVAVLSGIRAFYTDTAFQLGRKNAPLVWIMLLMLAANLALGLWLIPQHRELGAAIASCASCAIGLAVSAAAGMRVYRLPVPVLETAKIIASTGTMALVLIGLAHFSGPSALAGQIAAGSLVYAFSVVAFDVLDARVWLLTHARLWVRAVRPPARRAGRDWDR
jgi:O-antigen/teichoic acid export membrane protein